MPKELGAGGAKGWNSLGWMYLGVGNRNVCILFAHGRACDHRRQLERIGLAAAIVLRRRLLS